jgi:hypothetical protein
MASAPVRVPSPFLAVNNRYALEQPSTRKTPLSSSVLLSFFSQAPSSSWLFLRWEQGQNIQKAIVINDLWCYDRWEQTPE